MIGKRVFLIGILALTVFSGVALAESVHQYSFEEGVTENWIVESEEGGMIEQNDSRHTHGFASLAWNDQNGTDYATSSVRTKQLGLVYPEHTTLTFDYYQDTSSDDYDNIDIILKTPEENLIIYGEVSGSDLAYVGGSKAEYVETSEPPDNQWNHVEMEIQGDTIETTINNETLTTTMSEPIENESEVAIAIEFYNSGFDPAGNTYFVDNLVITQHTPELFAYNFTSTFAILGILAIILFAGVRLYSVSTIVMWCLSVIASIAVLVFEMDAIYMWFAIFLNLLVVLLSAVVFYNYD